MDHKLVILFPVYHKDKLEYIVQAIESLNKQDFNYFDLLVLIDGYINQDIHDYLTHLESSHTRVLNFEKNRGLAAVLNDGIDYALQKGYGFIGRMDADDVIPSNRLKLQMKYLRINPKVYVVGTNGYLIDEKGNIIGEKKLKAVVKLKDLYFRPEIIHPSVIFKADFFKKVGKYDSSLLRSQDYDLWFRALKENIVIHNIQEPLYFMRVNNDLINRRKDEQYINLAIKKRHLKGFRLIISALPNVFMIMLPMKIFRVFVKFIVLKRFRSK